MGAGGDTRTDEERRWQEALGERVRKLVQRGHLTALVIEQARRADHVLFIDFHGPRFNVFVIPRTTIAESIPADTDDRMLQEMMLGQPVLEPAEGTATWGFVTDEARPDKAPTHMRLRGVLP